MSDLSLANPTDPAELYNVGTPVASPGCCGTCGSANLDTRRFLNTKLDFEFYGSLYFCDQCIRAMANAMGWGDDSQINDLKQVIQTQATVIESLSNKLLEYEGILNGLSGYFGSSDNSDVGNIDVTEPEKPQSPEKDYTELVAIRDVESDGFDEQVNESGSDDLSDVNSGPINF